ncbi:MAG: Fe-S cluster assembly protein SufD [Leptolyngbyaceae cyanobacterium]
MASQVSESDVAPPISQRERREAYLLSLLETVRTAAPEHVALHNLRAQAAAIVKEQTFPSTRDEDWRFTDLSSMVAVPFQASLAPTELDPGVLQTVELPEAIARIVLVNGRYDENLSAVDQLPPGVVIGNLLTLLSGAIAPQLMARLAKAKGGHEPFTALNTAGFADAAVVWLPRNQAIEAPIQIVSLTIGQAQPVMTHPRCLVVAETGSALTIVEDFIGSHDYRHFTNSVTEIYADAATHVTHVRLQREGSNNIHVGKTAVTQGRDSQYTHVAVNLGAQISRHNLEVYQTGPQTDTNLYGLSAIAQSQLADTHSLIATQHPHGTADQLHKTIVDDKAHAVFNGKVWVPRAAQMTNASQLNRNLLLSDQARIDTKPELDIVADNVKCAHGATVSQLNAHEVFYLQSRGISAAAAQRLLIYGFAMDIIDRIPVSSLRQTLITTVTERSQSLP